MINPDEIQIKRDPDRPYTDLLYAPDEPPPTPEELAQYEGWILVLFRGRYQDKDAIYYQGVSRYFLEDEPRAIELLEQRARQEFARMFSSASPRSH